MGTTSSSKRRRADLIMVTVIVGVLGIGLFAFSVLNGMLSRVDTVVDSMTRIEAVGTYDGRPSATTDFGTNNYAVFAANSDGSLAAALILNLDADHQYLTVIGVPADTSLPDGTTLMAAFSDGPSTATKGLEQLTETQMTHQFMLFLSDCVPLIETADTEIVEQIDADLESYLESASSDRGTAARLTTVVTESLSILTEGSSLSDINRFGNSNEVITPCIAVDAGLTNEGVRSTVVNMKVRGQDIGMILLSDSVYSVEQAKRGWIPTVTPETLVEALHTNTLGSILRKYPSASISP